MAKNKNWTMKDILSKQMTEETPGVFQKLPENPFPDGKLVYKTVSSIKSEFPKLSKDDIEHLDNLVNNKIGRPHLVKAQEQVHQANLELEFFHIFIPGQVPSKKNSVNISCKTGLPVRYPSTQMTAYLASSKGAWISNRQKFLDAVKGLEMPYNIEFTFIRKTNQIFDHFGPGELVADLLTEYGYYSDDNTRVMKPFFGDARVDKNNPGVLIRIIKSVKIEYL